MTCRCSCSRAHEGHSSATFDYRAYLMDPDSHIVGVKEIDAQDDVEAMFKARSMNEDFAVELWDRARRVIRLQRRYASIGSN